MPLRMRSSRRGLASTSRKITKGVAASGRPVKAGGWQMTPRTSFCIARCTRLRESACCSAYALPYSRSGSRWTTWDPKSTSFGSSSGHPRESPLGPLAPPPPHTATYYAQQRSSSGRSMTAAGSEDINATRKRRDFTRRRMPRDLGAQLYSPFNQPARSRASRVVRRWDQQFCHS